MRNPIASQNVDLSNQQIKELIDKAKADFTEDEKKTFEKLKEEALRGMEVSIINPADWGRRDVIKKLSPGNIGANIITLHTTYLGREHHL